MLFSILHNMNVRTFPRYLPWQPLGPACMPWGVSVCKNLDVVSLVPPKQSVDLPQYLQQHKEWSERKDHITVVIPGKSIYLFMPLDFIAGHYQIISN